MKATILAITTNSISISQYTNTIHVWCVEYICIWLWCVLLMLYIYYTITYISRMAYGYGWDRFFLFPECPQKSLLIWLTLSQLFCSVLVTKNSIGSLLVDICKSCCYVCCLVMTILCYHYCSTVWINPQQWYDEIIYNGVWKNVLLCYIGSYGWQINRALNRLFADSLLHTQMNSERQWQ